MIAMTQVYLSPFENDVILEGRVKDFLDKIKNFNYTKIENKMKKIKQKVVKAGVDVKKIEQIVKLEVPKAVKGLKAKDTNAISTALKNIFTEMKENNLLKQIATAVITLVVVLVLNDFFRGFFSGLGLGKFMTFALTVTFMGPLIEEISKYFSIKMKATGMYFVVFNIHEFTKYIVEFIGIVSLPKLIGVRLLGVAVHATTTLFQKIQQEKGTPGKGLLIGTLIHAIYNGFATLKYFLQTS